MELVLDPINVLVTKVGQEPTAILQVVWLILIATAMELVFFLKLANVDLVLPQQTVLVNTFFLSTFNRICLYKLYWC